MAEMTLEQMQARLKALEEENAKLVSKLSKGEGFEVTINGKVYNPSLKVSSKSKGVSLYGLGRFPVTLFAPQWLVVLAIAKNIEEFIEKHKAELSWEKAADAPAAE